MTLIEKLTKAGLSVGGKLKADKRNQEQRYDYISADKILSVCGQALFEQGVIVLPEADSQTIEAVKYTNRRGDETTRYDATVEFVMNVTDGETSLQAKWAGVGSDYAVPDKALYKAITSGHKYFLMKLLNVGEGNEDGEHDPADQPTEDSKPAKQPAKQTAQKQPAKSNGNETPPAKANANKSWAAEYVKALIDNGLADNPPNAIGILNSLNPLDVNSAVDLARVYRGWRDSGEEANMAFQKTLAGERP